MIGKEEEQPAIDSDDDNDSLSDVSVMSDDLVITYANVVSCNSGNVFVPMQKKSVRTRTITNSNLKAHSEISAVQRHHVTRSETHSHRDTVVQRRQALDNDSYARGHPSKQLDRDTAVYGKGSGFRNNT